MPSRLSNALRLFGVKIEEVDFCTMPLGETRKELLKLMTDLSGINPTPNLRPFFGSEVAHNQFVFQVRNESTVTRLSAQICITLTESDGGSRMTYVPAEYAEFIQMRRTYIIVACVTFLGFLFSDTAMNFVGTEQIIATILWHVRLLCVLWFFAAWMYLAFGWIGGRKTRRAIQDARSIIRGRFPAAAIGNSFQ